MDKVFKQAPVNFQGKTYKPVVLRVVEEDDKGQAILCRVYREGDNIRLSQDVEANKFHIVFAESL